MIYSRKVDFHSHFLSETYLDYLKRYVGADPDGFPTPRWSVQAQLSEMDRLGIAFAFLSESSPNLSAAPKQEEVRMVHQINLEGYEIVRAHPDRFGLLAGLPLPHTEEAISEAVFVLDELHADGFALSTHYAGVYLSDERYEPLLRFLNERKALVAVHPVKPFGLPERCSEELPIPAMEFLMDTTRTFTYMVLHDIFGRFPEIKWIFPHAGAFISVLSDRIAGFSMQFRSRMESSAPVDFKADMRHVYFDVAGFAANKQLHDLLLDVSHRNLLYGSDAPYTPPVACIAHAGALENTQELSDDRKSDLFTRNAVALVPRLAELLQVEADESAVCYAQKKLGIKERGNRVIRSIISRIYGWIFG